MRRRCARLLPIAYCGAVERLVCCLRRGMLSRDAMGWAGCGGAHPRGISRKVVVMQEGHTAISWRVKGMRKERRVVEHFDLVPPRQSRKSLRSSGQYQWHEHY